MTAAPPLSDLPASDRPASDRSPPGLADILPSLIASQRSDGWTPARQKRFLEAIADGCTVEAACALVGLSVGSAYAFRRRAAGAAFALGWRGAVLVARDTVADALLTRALDGQVDVISRPDGSTITRHRYDNRLAAGLLARLDRQAEGLGDADTTAARMVAGEFDAYLAQLEHAAAPAAAGLFLARRTGDTGDARDLAPVLALASADRFARLGVATADQVPVADCLAADRADWTADQWRRAEAAGLVRLAAEPPETPSEPLLPLHVDEPDAPATLGDRIWFDDLRDRWCTDFPPLDDFDGIEDAVFGEDGYSRSLTDYERAAIGDPVEDPDVVEAQECAERDRWFADYGRRHGHSLGDAPSDDAAAAPPSEARAPAARPVAAATPDGDPPVSGARVATVPIATPDPFRSPAARDPAPYPFVTVAPDGGPPLPGTARFATVPASPPELPRSPGARPCIHAFGPLRLPVAAPARPPGVATAPLVPPGPSALAPHRDAGAAGSFMEQPAPPGIPH